jgi:tRNA (guanine37-N1)-methyltransferase
MLIPGRIGRAGDADAAAAVSARPAIELSRFYTRAVAHGSGTVAGPLMRATIDAAGAARASTVWLGVNEENARAIRFYEKHGFGEGRAQAVPARRSARGGLGAGASLG